MYIGYWIRHKKRKEDVDNFEKKVLRLLLRFGMQPD